ncbi:hypothetical protein EJ110_NYTH31230 [Nymphaea thermarum]|nr:hypothetical protein EJ110_NYTH31230 [Nymphaea thermarum]
MKLSLDILLVPPSVALIVGYHVVLWCILKTQPLRTRRGITATRRRTWALALTERLQSNLTQKIFNMFSVFVWFEQFQNGSRGMLGVQSLRNSLMAAILASTIAILTNSALAAMMNNIYNAHKLLHLSPFGSQADSIILLKYSLSSVFLLATFFCSSLGIGFLTEANFLINVTEGVTAKTAHTMLELGSELASVGNRVLFAAVPMLLWMFGPVSMAVSSVLLVCFFYDRDFNTGCRSGDVNPNSASQF